MKKLRRTKRLRRMGSRARVSRTDIMEATVTAMAGNIDCYW